MFIYVGLSSVTLVNKAYSISFFSFQLLFVFLSRFIAVFLVLALTRLLTCNKLTVSLQDQTVMLVAGSIKGAIAFGLAISLKHVDDERKQVILTTIMGLVFVTTIILGGLLPWLIRKLKGKTSDHLEQPMAQFRVNSNIDYYINDEEKENEEKLKEEANCLYSVWKIIDKQFLRKYFIYDWENASRIRKELTTKLNKVVEEFEREKEIEKVNENLLE